MRRNDIFRLALAASLLMGCKSMNKTQKGAAIGTAGGAAVGAVVGKAAGNTALGAIIGAVVGGGTGAIIGHKMDKQAEEIKKQVPGAKVTRVGEGIEVEFTEKILFAFGKYNLQDEAKRNITNLVNILYRNPDTNIEIQGHTDNIGSESYNLQLSRQRAQAVEAYLINAGIAGRRLTTRAMGKDYPKYPNDTEENRAQNRRVEFLITANEKMKQDAAKEAQSN